MRITFGTSGWRGILCEDFVFENIKVVTQAIADHVISQGDKAKGLIVGYDSRFMGERFAKESARVLTGAGIKTFFCSRDIPTPVIAFEILRRKTAGAINFTASHNPPEYNGIKFSPSWGGPALPETTQDIERRANEMLGEICYRERQLDDAIRDGLLEEIDPKERYLKNLAEKVDFAAITGLGTIALNPLYGTARGYLEEPLMIHHGKIKLINAYRDPYFGGFPPNLPRSIYRISSTSLRETQPLNSGLPPTAMPTGLASLTRMAPISSRIISSPCSSTISSGCAE